MSIIQVTNASKTYGKGDEIKVEALKKATFSVEEGEFVCIIGTSGSGKSTLLHLLAGVDSATEGSIIINNKEITQLNQEDLAEFRRCEVGIIYQFFNLVPVLTAKENIELPLMLAGEKVDRAYFNEITQMLGIENRLDFYPSKLSGGEQQRVAIARALIHRPSIILADEPTGNLNSQLAKEIMEFLVMASKQLNQTIIMITHDLNLAKYADRIIEIQDGRLVSDRKKEEKTKTVMKLREGYDENTGNYVIDEEKYKKAMRRLYEKDKESIEKTGKHASMDKEVARYCQMMKESKQGIKEGQMLLVANVSEKKVTKIIRTNEELYNFIQTSNDMTEARKRQILRFIEGER